MPESPRSQPHSAEARLEHALQLARAGRTLDAIRVLRDLFVEAPELIAARTVLAMILHQIGEPVGALVEIDLAVSLEPVDVVAQEVRATVLAALGKMAEAETAARAALAIDPRRARAWETLGLALDAQERSQEAISALKSSLLLQPASATARQVIARRLLQAGDAETALDFARHPSLLGDVARAEATAADFLGIGAGKLAIDLLQALVRRRPDSYSSVMLLARSLHQMTRSSEALPWSELAHTLRPTEIEPIEMRAVSLVDRGDVDAGLTCLRDLASRPEATAETGNRYLILAHYDPHESNEALFRAHEDWVHRYVGRFGPPFAAHRRNESNPALRIGWLSPRFGAGPVASFFTGLLKAFDRQAYRHILIPLRSWNDEATHELRGLADEWLPAQGLDDEALLKQLRAANLDIAIDLAGHSFGNRLAVLAQRVAPIQLCWLDYFNTTAVTAITAGSLTHG